MNRRSIFYATRSQFKPEEIRIISDTVDIDGGNGLLHKVGDIVDIHISDIRTEEPLEINLVEMVKHKARSAYKTLLSPCIVEHAGLIFESENKNNFPGGLTQPMWDALSPDGFLARLNCANERATARAVIGYCNGMDIHTFTGETTGTIAPAPRGDRTFYWDTIFCPDDGGGKTYAEICAEPGGLEIKIKMSQSAKAVAKFASFLLGRNGKELFDMR